MRRRLKAFSKEHNDPRYVNQMFCPQEHAEPVVPQGEVSGSNIGCRYSQYYLFLNSPAQFLEWIGCELYQGANQFNIISGKFLGFGGLFFFSSEELHKDLCWSTRQDFLQPLPIHTLYYEIYQRVCESLIQQSWCLADENKDIT